MTNSTPCSTRSPSSLVRQPRQIRLPGLNPVLTLASILHQTRASRMSMPLYPTSRVGWTRAWTPRLPSLDPRSRHQRHRRLDPFNLSRSRIRELSRFVGATLEATSPAWAARRTIIRVPLPLDRSVVWIQRAMTRDRRQATRRSPPVLSGAVHTIVLNGSLRDNWKELLRLLWLVQR